MAYTRSGKYVIKHCPCGKELPYIMGYQSRMYCSDKCAARYGKGHRGSGHDAEAKAQFAKYQEEWAKDLTIEQLTHWFSIKNESSPINKNLHGDRFIDAFDREYGLMYVEIVGLMYSIQRYGQEKEG